MDTNHWIDILKWDIQHNQNTENMLKDTAFCHLPNNLVISMVKKVMDTAAKTGINAAKTATKRIVQKPAEATEDLIGNKIADKINSVGKSKEKEKTKKVEEILNNRHKVVCSSCYFVKRK